MTETGIKTRTVDDMARITAGAYALKPERIVVAEVIADVVELYDAKAEYQGVAVTLDLEPGLTGQWDRAAVDTIVSNLVSNVPAVMLLLPMAERNHGWPLPGRLRRRASVHPMAPIHGIRPSKPVPTKTSKSAPCSDDNPVVPRMWARA